MREQILSEILKRDPYSGWKKVGRGRLGLGAWRDTAGDDNPHIQLDAYGLYDFREGRATKSLWAVGRELGIPGCEKAKKKEQADQAPKKGDESDPREKKRRFIAGRLEHEGGWLGHDWPIIKDYFARERGIPCGDHPEFFKKLGCCVQTFTHSETKKEVTEIVFPLPSPRGELVQILKIEIGEDGRKAGKKLQFEADDDRAVVFGPTNAREVIAIEGIEDALTLRFCCPEETQNSRFVVSCGATYFSRLAGFLRKHRSRILICDPDTNETSLRQSLQIPKELEVARFVPTAAEGGAKAEDVNAALMRGGVEAVREWTQLLQKKTWEEIEAAATQFGTEEDSKAIELGESDAHEFHRVRYPDTDSGAAKFFAIYFGSKVRLTEDGSWWVWGGKRWTADHAEGRVRKLIAGLAPIYEREAQRLMVGPQTDEVKQKQDDLMAFAKSLGSHRRQYSVMQALQAEEKMQCKVSDFDAMPHLLNVQNGILNLDTGDLLAHSPEMLCSRICSVEWKGEQEAPVFDRFLWEICCGDKDLLSYKLRQWGYLLSGHTSEKTFFFHIGNGNNGKSVEADVLLKILGSYGRTVSVEMFLEQRHSSDSAMYEIAYLPGIRLAVASETDENRKWSEAVLKKMTGGSDELVARHIRQAPFTFKPVFKPLIHGNQRPKITTGDEALWRRLHMVPYNFTATTPDIYLEQKLLLEAPGILYRAWQGYREWKATGLVAPEVVVEAREEYRSETFGDVEEFIDERCEVGPEFEEKATVLYETYKDFCSDRHAKIKTHTAFGAWLTKMGFPLKESSNGKPFKDWKGKKYRVGLRTTDSSPQTLDPRKGSASKSSDIDDDSLF